MGTKDLALPLVAGLGVGAVVGYGLAGATGVGAKPIIKVFPNPVASGATYSIYFEGFPPNTQIVGVSIPGNWSAPQNFGVTGANGVLTVSATAVGTGTWYIVAWDALTGQYCAEVTLVVN